MAEHLECKVYGALCRRVAGFGKSDGLRASRSGLYGFFGSWVIPNPDPALISMGCYAPNRCGFVGTRGSLLKGSFSFVSVRGLDVMKLQVLPGCQATLNFTKR